MELRGVERKKRRKLYELIKLGMLLNEQRVKEHWPNVSGNESTNQPQQDIRTEDASGETSEKRSRSGGIHTRDAV